MRTENSSWGHLLVRHLKCKNYTPCPLGMRRKKTLPHSHIGTTHQGVLGYSIHEYKWRNTIPLRKSEKISDTPRFFHF